MDQRTTISGNPKSTSWSSRLSRWAAVGAAVLCLSVPARSQESAGSKVPAAAITTEPGDVIRVTVNKSRVVSTTRPYKRVSIAQPDVAEVTPVNPTTILLTARKAGSTQLILWDDADHAQVMEVSVLYDLQALNDQLKATFPGAQIEASAGNGAIVLRGLAPDLTVSDQAAQLAAPYGTKVLNFTQIAGGQQVMLQVRFAELSRAASTELGVNFGFADGHSFGASNIGQVSPLGITGDSLGAGILGLTTPTSAVTLFGRGEAGSTTFAYFISALRQNNLLRILAEPNVVAMSGQEAEFLAGGTLPIPVAQNAGSSGTGPTITIEKWEYGVKLKFTPIVMGDGRIRLKVSPEVSDLDFTTAVKVNGFLIPGLTQRKLTTTVELCEGQTFALAGLLSNSVTASKDVTPLLGDLPILGALFRSVRYQRKETELVVMVTPRLVAGVNPGQVPPGPGEQWRYPSEGELFLNQDLGGSVKASKTPPPAPRYIGPHGFTPSTQPTTSGK